MSKGKLVDPNAPKKPFSAFMLWSQSNQKGLKAEYPNHSFGDFAKLLGSKWRELSDEAKKEWSRIADENMERYRTEKTKYMASPNYAKFVALSSDSSIKKKGKKDANAPKKPLTPYFSFTKSNLSKVQQEFPDASFAERGRILGEKWKQLSDSQKKPYEEEANADRTRYQREMEQYQRATA